MGAVVDEKFPALSSSEKELKLTGHVGTVCAVPHAIPEWHLRETSDTGRIAFTQLAQTLTLAVTCTWRPVEHNTRGQLACKIFFAR